MRVCEVFNLFQKQFMKEYLEYFLEIEGCLEKISFLTKSKRNTTFHLKLETCKQRCRFKNWTLNELLISPFQRISKYHLLLKELHKKRSASDVDLKLKIEHAWKTAESVCAYLNEIKRDQESITRIKKIFSSLGLAPELMSGRLMKEDNIRIKYLSGGEGLGLGTDLNASNGSLNTSNGSARARTRTVFLFEKTLLILSKNLFNKYEIRDRISIYEINTSKESLQHTR